MANARRKEPVARVESEQLQEIDVKWTHRPVKEPVRSSMRNVVEIMFDNIILQRDKGYSWEDICSFIEEDFKAAITPQTLKSYVREVQRTRKAAINKKKLPKGLKAVSAVKHQNTNAVIPQSEGRRKEANRLSGAPLEESSVGISAMIDATPNTDNSEELQKETANSISNERKETSSKESGDFKTRSKSSTPSERPKFNTLIMDRSKL